MSAQAVAAELQDSIQPSEVAEPADFSLACKKGRALGNRFLQDMRDQDFTPALGFAIKNMMSAGRFGGVEIGFLHVIADAACRSQARS